MEWACHILAHLPSVTQDDVHASSRTTANGLQPWTEQGIAGRGVLVDFAGFAERNGIDLAHFAPHAITVEQVVEIAREQKTEFRTGDILFLRTGYIKAYRGLSQDKRDEVASVREWCGLGQSRSTTEWLWQNQFSAVVSDSPGFEVRRKFT